MRQELQGAPAPPTDPLPAMAVEPLSSPEQAPARAAVRAVLHRFGIDRAVGTTVAARLAQAASSLILMFLIASRLSGVQQGYYMTLNSVASAQVFFELGLTYVLLQFASHEVARLVRQVNGRYEGDYASKARLASLYRFGMKWYSVAALLLVALVLPAGYWFFATSYHGSGAGGWQIPWLVLGAATAWTLLTNAQIAILEGCGHVAEVAGLRLRETLLGTAAAAVILALGGGLYAVAALVVCDAGAETVWLYARRTTLFDLWQAHDPSVVIDWRAEMWPFQWKIAVSWLSGYFIFQLANPVLFRAVNPAEAGRMGLTIQACTGLTALAMAWITTKAPKMGSLISLGNRPELDAVFFRAAKTAVCAAALMAGAFWVIVTAAQSSHVSIALRFAEPLALGLMLLSATANCIVFAQAQYLRAHKTEPFLALSIASAVANLALVFALVGPFGVRGVAVAYAFTSCVLGVGGGTYIFLRERRTWSAA